jgi:ATP-dependent Clp protease ATP-binding subunit ClpA
LGAALVTFAKTKVTAGSARRGALEKKIKKILKQVQDDKKEKQTCPRQT